MHGVQWSQWAAGSLAADLPPAARALLGPNEPNHHLQANLTPEAAAQLWPTLQKVAPLVAAPSRPRAAPALLAGAPRPGLAAQPATAGTACKQPARLPRVWLQARSCRRPVRRGGCTTSSVCPGRCAWTWQARSSHGPGACPAGGRRARAAPGQPGGGALRGRLRAGRPVRGGCLPVRRRRAPACVRRQAPACAALPASHMTVGPAMHAESLSW